MKTLVKIFFDGACDNNSKFKFMGIGAAVFVNDYYREDLSRYAMIGTSGTNNIAEWGALQMGLEIANDLVSSEEFSNVDLSIRIYGDSQIIVSQFNGMYRIRQDHFIPYYRKCRTLYFGVENVVKSVDWIPRQQNTQADILSKKGITEFLKENKMI